MYFAISPLAQLTVYWMQHFTGCRKGTSTDCQWVDWRI